MIPSPIRYLALCTVLAACGGDKPPKMASMAEALPSIPFPPDPTIVGRAGGPDALQLTVRSTVPADKVAEYYRGVFKQGEWRLLNDARDADGATVLLAQQHGTPLWVRIHAGDEGQGTVVELNGAVVEHADSTGVKPKPAT
jgi:hypothetical protein